MKKFYFSLTLALLGLANIAVAQYTATNSGNWSNPITWAPGAIPPTICNNCTVTINSGVTVQLDAHLELAGSSLLYIGTSPASAATINIGNSSNTTIATGYNIVLDTVPGNSMIIFTNYNSTINAAAAGAYDGILVGPLPNSVYQKVIGNKPSLFIGDNAYGSSPPTYGQSVTGPKTLFSGGTLPITLVNFKASLNNNSVDVSWTTLQEVNADHFDVQRSTDDKSWQTIGTIAAHGNSSIPLNYYFTDASPSNGYNYYRLRSFDQSGKYIYSVVAIVRGSASAGVKVFPNPASSYVNISLGNDITANQVIRLTDIYGKVLQEKQVNNAAGTTLSLPVGNYPKGIYLLHVKSADGSQQVYKVFVSQD